MRPVRTYVALTKPRIIELLLVTTLPTMFVAARRLPSAGLVLAVLVGGAMAAGGANALNMVYDRDIDARMERTRHRPLVTGEVSPARATVFAVALELAAFGLLWGAANLLSAALAVGAAAFYLFVYTMWLKRSTSQNIVIGGAAGAVPALVGWSAVTGHLGWAPLLLFGIVLLWTPPHFWALAVRYRDDYSAADVPMLPSVRRLETVTAQILLYTVAVVALSLCLPLVADVGAIYLVVAGLAGAAFIGSAVKLRRDSNPRSAMRLFGFSITYLTLVFVAMGVDAIVRHP
jgi:protoheme IX farnesyltransferase